MARTSRTHILPLLVAASSGLWGCPVDDRTLVTGSGGTTVVSGGDGGTGNAAGTGNDAGGDDSAGGGVAGTHGGSVGEGGDGATSGTETGGTSGTGGNTGTGGNPECQPSGAHCSCSGDVGDECSGEPCCRLVNLPSGSFDLGGSGDSSVSASLASYGLDEFEVTVGRFRKFVEAYVHPPLPNAGQHPFIVGSGWQGAWDPFIARDSAALAFGLACHSSQATWTNDADANEARPINCVTWFEAFAFCVWDGGRLPTEAEWEYAASGGDSGSPYPWGEDPPTYDRAVFNCGGKAVPDCTVNDLLRVGSKPNGAGRFAHADLAGSLAEWVLDWHSPYDDPCNDCAKVDGGSERVTRGGSFLSVSDSELTATVRAPENPGIRLSSVGFRCARDD